MIKYFRLNKYYLLVILSLISNSASANVGIPMIAVTMPLMLVTLIPVVVIEAYVIKSPLNLSMKKALQSSAIANIVSTLLGVPLTWTILLIAQMFTGGGRAYGLQSLSQKFIAVTWQAPWLLPYESDLVWMIPTAQLVLLIPFFYVSWLTEYHVAKRINKQIQPQLIKSSFFKANLVSYALLALWCIIGIAIYYK